MIHYKDRSFCASSGRCANTDCPRWIDFGQARDLPLSLTEFKDTDHCEGFVENRALTALKYAIGVKV